MARMTLLVPVRSANFYVNNKTPGVALSRMVKPLPQATRPRLVSAQEFRKQKSAKITGYTKFQCEHDEWMANNAVFLRNAGAHYLGHGFQQLTDRISKDPIGAPRSTVWVSWEERGIEFSGFSAHAPAGGRPQVEKARKCYMEGLLDLANTQHALGHLTIIAGDLNDVDVPLAMLKKAGFTVIQNRVDYVAMKRRGAKFSLGSEVLIPEEWTGSDHDWLCGTVTAKVA